MKIEIDTQKIVNVIKAFHPKASAFHRFITWLGMILGVIVWDIFACHMISSAFNVGFNDSAIVCTFSILLMLGITVATIVVFGED